MTYLIFGGDMLVMAFMIAVVVWISLRANDEGIAAAARIPLEDEQARQAPDRLPNEDGHGDA